MGNDTKYLKYALNTKGELVHIDSVPNGNDCGCICPACKKPLQAKNKGTHRTHHFAHQSGVDCPTAYESSLHLLAKKKIQEETKILEPEKDKVKKELESLENTVDKRLLEEYKKRRNDNIFPVVVPLEGKNFCGRCRMELPMVAISRINDTGVITCEHCKRLVYKK